MRKVTGLKIAIIGAGHSGLAMSAHLAFHDHEINLWNRSRETIAELIHNPCIESMGRISGYFPISLVTTDMEKALSGRRLVLVTTPSSAHRDIARHMAPYLTRNHIVILNPGRTFGAIEFKDELVRNDNHQDVRILEAQTIIYTCRKVTPTKVNIIATKREVLISSFEGVDLDPILSRLPEALSRFYVKAPSMVETSIGNVGMILHCAPMLLNVGWIESGIPFRYYREGICRSVASYLEKMDKERMDVADALNHQVLSVRDWMRNAYGIEGDSLYECIQNNRAYEGIMAPRNLHHRYVEEDIPCGLVPLESMGKDMGIDMRHVSAIIDLAQEITGVNYRETGRTVGNLHIDYKKFMRGASSER